MYSRLRRLAGHSLIYTGGDLLNRALAFLLIPLYTAYLTPADYGILAITTTVSAILSILYLQSLESALTRFHYDMPDEDGRRDYYGTIWLLMVVSSLIISLAVEFAGGALTELVLKDVPYLPYIRLVVWTTFLTNCSILLFRAVLRVQEKPKSYVALNVAAFLTTTGLIVYFVVVKEQGALGSLQGRFLSSLLLAVPVSIAYLRQARLSWSWTRARASLKFALPLMPHLLSLWVLNLSDRLILQRFVSLDEVGIYSLGYQLAAIVQLVAFSAMNAWSPFFYKTADEPGAPIMLSRFSTYYWLVVAVFGTAVAVLAKDALVIMASRPAFNVAYSVVPWVVMGFVIRAFYFVFVTALYHRKKVMSIPVVTVVSGLLNIGLNLILIPRFGYMAAAVNTFVAYAFQSIIMYFLAQRAYPMPYEGGRVLRLFVVGIGIYAVASLVPLASAWQALGVKVALLGTYPIWLTLIGFWSDEETAILRRLPRRALLYFESRMSGTIR